MRGCVLVWAAVLWLTAAGTAIAGASPSVDAFGGSIARPASGIYVLDRAIGFNVLDAAAIDPKSGRIMLVGHRDKRYGEEQIPYLELLATLLKNPTPEFSLNPTPDSMRRVDSFFASDPAGKILKILMAMYMSGHATPEGRSLLGLPVVATDADVAARLIQLGGNIGQATSLRSALMAAMNGPNGLQIDGAGIQSSFTLNGPLAESSPVYRGLDANSELARRMYEADYLSKGLTHEPDLSRSIPGYQTEFTFLRRESARGQAENEQVWISIDRLDLARCWDGQTLETRGVRMRVNVREQAGPSSSLTTKLGKPTPYEALMTALYDPFSQRYPLLHELSEAAKLAAVARWIRAQHRTVTLPSAGLTRWSGPQTVPARLYVYVYVPPGQAAASQNFAVRAAFVAEGGVKLDPFPAGDSALRDIHVDPIVLDLNKTALAAAPPLTGLPLGSKAVAWVKNVPGDMPYQVAAAGLSDLSGDLAGSTGANRGPFGESQPVPNLAPANYPPVGSNKSALDQVRSATASGGAARAAAVDVDASGNAKLAFDTSGGPDAPMPAPPPTQEGEAADRPRVPSWALKDPHIYLAVQKLLQKWDQGEQAREQDQARADDLTKQYASTTDSTAQQNLAVSLAQAKQKVSDDEAQQNYVKFEVIATVSTAASTSTNAGAAPGVTGP